MTLILKFDLDMVKMYLHVKNEVSMLRGSKVIAWTDRNTDRQTDTQTHRHTDMTKNITYPCMQVVIIIFIMNERNPWATSPEVVQLMLLFILFYYHPHMWVCMFSVISVCPSVCLSVCLCVGLCVCLCICVSACSGYNFWTPWHFWYAGTSWPYLGQVWVSRSFGQGQGHMRKNDNYTYFKLLILCMWL